MADEAPPPSPPVVPDATSRPPVDPGPAPATAAPPVPPVESPPPAADPVPAPTGTTPPKAAPPVETPPVSGGTPPATPAAKAPEAQPPGGKSGGKAAKEPAAPPPGKGAKEPPAKEPAAKDGKAVPGKPGGKEAPPPVEPAAEADYSTVHDCLIEMDSVITSLRLRKDIEVEVQNQHQRYLEESEGSPDAPSDRDGSPPSVHQTNSPPQASTVSFKDDVPEYSPPAPGSQEASLLDAIDLIRRQSEIVSELHNSTRLSDRQEHERESHHARQQIEDLIAQLSDSQNDVCEYKRKLDVVYAMYQQCHHNVKVLQEHCETLTQRNQELQQYIAEGHKVGPGSCERGLQTDRVKTADVGVHHETIPPPSISPASKSQTEVPSHRPSAQVPQLTEQRWPDVRLGSPESLPAQQSLPQSARPDSVPRDVPHGMYAGTANANPGTTMPHANVFSWLGAEHDSLPPTPGGRTPVRGASALIVSGLESCADCGNVSATYCSITGKRHRVPAVSSPSRQYNPSDVPLHDTLRQGRATLSILQGEVARAAAEPRPTLLQGGTMHSQQMRAHYRAILTHFYSKHNPGKLNEVEQILDLFQGNENELLMLLAMKYDQQADAAAQGPSGRVRTAAFQQANVSNRYSP